MEKFEKKEKKESEWPDNVQAGVRMTLAKMKADPEARMVLRGLAKQGFDEGRIAKTVYFYCGGTDIQARAGLKAMLKFADDLEKLGVRLIEDGYEFEKAIEKLAKGGTGVVSVQIRISISVETEKLPELMAEAGLKLAIAADTFKKGLSNIRIGGKKNSARKNKSENQAVNISAGRTQWLFYLAYLIGGDQGPSIEHYGQIARLVAAVRGDRGRVYKTIAQTLERAANRFRGENLERAMMLAAAAQEESNSRSAPPPA
jgi:hypothetical protein